MDSLRADRIRSVVENARPETPTFDKLLETSAVFTQAYMQGNETKCSHASIWTSLYPIRHMMIPPNSQIDKKWVTVDEVAKSAGLFTSGVSGNGYITPKRGFGEKWDKYRNHIHEGGGLRAEDILGKAVESIASPKEPFFLYLGTIDTHVSWRAKQPWLSKYDPGPYSGRYKVEASGKDMGKVATGKIKVNERDIKRIVALYDSNVSYQDQQLGLLLDKLAEWGVADDTMVIVTADHGDELFEFGRVGHGGPVLESLVSRAAGHPLPAAVPGRQGGRGRRGGGHRADRRRRARRRAGRELAGRVAHRAGPGPGPRLSAPVDGVEVRERPRRAPRALEGVQRRRLEVGALRRGERAGREEGPRGREADGAAHGVRRAVDAARQQRGVAQEQVGQSGQRERRRSPPTWASDRGRSDDASRLPNGHEKRHLIGAGGRP